MSWPSTLVTRASGDGDTVVEARSRPSNVPPASDQASWRKTTTRWTHRAKIELAAVLAFTIAIATIAFHQWRVVDELRTAIVELRRDSARALLGGQAHAPKLGSRSRKFVSEFQAPPLLPIDEHERLENQGARLIAAHDYRGALAHYRMLAAAAPEEEVFQRLVVVLESKVPCAKRSPKAGLPCR